MRNQNSATEHINDQIRTKQKIQDHHISFDSTDEDFCPPEATQIGRIQMFLAAKRTSLAVLRTGIALLSLPMSIVALLIATSRYYDVVSTLHFFIPLFIINTFLVILGIILIIRSWRRVVRYDRAIERLKRETPELSYLME